ncbi:MAG TPA: hypothetical protein DC049_10145 [Spirochaetia bacterium]|nr:hypothetical protein [Spirochaetia bacterium]
MLTNHFKSIIIFTGDTMKNKHAVNFIFTYYHIKKVFILFFTVIVFCLNFLSAQWYSNWNYRKIITNNLSPAGDLTNFPLLVVISNDSDLSSYASNNGYDIVFTLGVNTNKLAHEIESYSAGTLIAWVKMPFFSASVQASNMLYMYFDKTKPCTVWNASNVWTEGYWMVHHFNEAVSPLLDSSSNGYNGTWNFTSGTSTLGAAGVIGKGAYFDGTNDYIDLVNLHLPLNKSFTMSIWQKSEVTEPNATSRYSLYSNYFYFKKYQDTNIRKYYFYLLDGNGTNRGSSYNIPEGTEYSWFNHTAVYNQDENQYYVYANSSMVKSQSCTNTSKTSIIQISASGNDGWMGYLDESRISTNIRSSNWIAAEYSNYVNPAEFRLLGAKDEYGLPEISINALASPPAIPGQRASFNIAASVAPGIVTNIRIDYGDSTAVENTAVSGSSVVQTINHTYSSGAIVLLSAVAYADSGKTCTNLIYITPSPYAMPAVSNIQTFYQNEGIKFTFNLPSANINRVVIYRDNLQLSSISPVSAEMEYLDRYLLYNTVYTYQIGAEYASGMTVSSNITCLPLQPELVQKTIGVKGGTLANLVAELAIPAGAFSQDIIVSMHIYSNLLYNFQPEYVSAYNQVRIETVPQVHFNSNARFILRVPFVNSKIRMFPEDGKYAELFVGSENLLTIASYSETGAWVPLYSRSYDQNVLPNFSYKLLAADLSDPGKFGVSVIINKNDYTGKVIVKNRVFTPGSVYSAMSKVMIFFPNTAYEDVLFQIFRMDGKKVHERCFPGAVTLVSWDGINDCGKISDSGLYIAVITKGGKIRNAHRANIYLLK